MENPEPAGAPGPDVRGPDKPKRKNSYPANRKSFFPSRHKARYARKGQFRPGQAPPRPLPSKLTENDVKWIRGVIRLDRRSSRRRSGNLNSWRSPRVTPGLFDRIAAKFNVSRWCIEAIDRRRTWKLVKAKRFTER